MLFNGVTKFKTGPRSVDVSSILLDDAHACLDVIRDCFVIKLNRGTQTYADLISLFSASLSDQGAGTFAEIKSRDTTAFIPVPYWEWHDKHQEVVNILAKYTDSESLRFVWPIMKDRLQDCLCLVSGTHIEISPYALPLDIFGTYQNATQRIYMSATINDDSFFIKGLGVAPEAVKSPLRYEKEKWSGEKMVLIPSLIDDSLTRDNIVNKLGIQVKGRDYGVVALVPSFEQSKLWEHCGSIVAKKETINDIVQSLKAKNGESPVVFANRYDGIDLPDNACRVLILDSKPFAEELFDRYQEGCRGNSDLIETKLAQVIEQGMGRHIRGEKDFGVTVLIGASLVRSIRSRRDRRFFSSQTRHQIEIGLEIAEFAKEDIAAGKDPYAALTELIVQCVNRNDPRSESWKAFYKEKMDEMPDENKDTSILDILISEKMANDLTRSGKLEQAIAVLQKLLDTHAFSNEERGWYLQEMARYTYPLSKLESNRYQLAAHKNNGALLKPKDGMVVQMLTVKSQHRISAIKEWMRSFGNAEDMVLDVDRILDGLHFGVLADRFEQSLDELGTALGFSTERPDKKWKAGPDNLWCIRDGEYVLIECKSEVNIYRKEIYKEETGQLNNAIAWFGENYPGCKLFPIIIIPSKELGSGAGFTTTVNVIRDGKLGRLRKAVRGFFREFSVADLDNISDKTVENALATHQLSSIESTYSEPIKTLLH
jgi:hypothetical protein